MRIQPIIIALALRGVASTVCADQPPAQAATLCNVVGTVKTVMQEEMHVQGQTTHVMVPVVILEVSAASPVDSNYKGDFCSHITTTPASGKPTGYYRLCDANADFMSAQTIHGVVGLSKGGGRLCLAQISVQP